MVDHRARPRRGVLLLVYLAGGHPALGDPLVPTPARPGRRARRTMKVLTPPAWITFAHAAQVAQIRRTVTRAGHRGVEVVYITSADHRTAPTATLGSWVCRHWGIDNSLHWVRDAC